MESLHSLTNSLTIGQVSGLISLANSVAGITAPLLLAILLLRHFDRSRSATTWSVIARQLHATSWPSILRTDSVSQQYVDRSVGFVAYMGIFLGILTFLTGFVTPLGLDETIAMTGNRTVDFTYAPDLTGYGRNTQKRPDLPPSRDCIVATYFCPGAIVPDSVINQGNMSARPNPKVSATTGVPNNFTAMFSSATKDSTVAGIFDIQYRSWKKTTSEFFDNGKEYVSGVYRSVDNLISQESFTVVEGAIANMDAGGIGYRNHTLPSGVSSGMKWDEDILWIEPDVSCTNTNLSFELTLGNSSSSFMTGLSDFALVDDGGFADLRHGNPYEGWPNLTYSDPDVELRADRTAWLHNVLLSMIFNLTDTKSFKHGIQNATLGRRFPLSPNNTVAMGIAPLGVRTSLLAPEDFLPQLPAVGSTDDGKELTLDGKKLGPPEEHSFAWAVYLLADLKGRCIGQMNDVSSSEDFNVDCGYFFGFPSRTDGGSPMEEEAGSKWKLPIHICAGAAKASVKSTSFSLNETSTLKDLTVTSVTDKFYPDKASQPLWAFEDWWYPGYEGAYAAPLWGLVDDSYEGTKGYNFSRRPDLYLPYTYYFSTWVSGLDDDAPLDSLAGPVAPFAILTDVLSRAFSPQSSSNGRSISYGGADNLVLRSKWSSLSGTTQGVEQILRLVWTDMMTSTTVGTNTRGVPPVVSGGDKTKRDDDVKSSNNGNRSNPGQVRLYARKITYDLKYAIPAFFLLTTWLIVIVAAFVSGVLHRHVFSHMRQLLNDTSIGRVGAMAVHPNARPLARSSTKDWVAGVGYVKFRLGGNTKTEDPNSETYELITRGAPPGMLSPPTPDGTHEFGKSGAASPEERLLK